MKEGLFQALLATVNKLYPLRGVRNTGDWFTVGCFSFEGRMYSFMIDDTKGTLRCMEGADYANEWFDVVKNYANHKGNRFTAIVHAGKKYSHQPMLF